MVVSASVNLVEKLGLVSLEKVSALGKSYLEVEGRVSRASASNREEVSAHDVLLLSAPGKREE